MNLSNLVKITQIHAPAGAGTTTLTGTVDMQGYDGVLFLTSIGTANTGNYLKAGGGAASNGSDASDYAGTKCASDGTSKELVLDMYKPLDRYVTASLVIGSSSTCDGIWALQYAGMKLPEVNAVANTLGLALAVSPAKGTP